MVVVLEEGHVDAGPRRLCKGLVGGGEEVEEEVTWLPAQQSSVQLV
jgi:hypothetical protein